MELGSDRVALSGGTVPSRSGAVAMFRTRMAGSVSASVPREASMLAKARAAPAAPNGRIVALMPDGRIIGPGTRLESTPETTR